MSVKRTNFCVNPAAVMTTFWWLFIVLGVRELQVSGQLVDTDFQPSVTAHCKSGHMMIKVNLNQSFVGVVHVRDHRKTPCMVQGNGENHATLDINLLAPPDAPDYCAVRVNNSTEERSVPIVVRIHKTLELADDKSYFITCGKARFNNAKNETSSVSLGLFDGDGHRVKVATYGGNYTLRAAISAPDGTYAIRVKSCFGFNKKNSSVQLIDDRGCPVKTVPQIMTKFIFNPNTSTADATVFSMFKFPDNEQVHVQCDVGLCKGSCGTPVCDGDEDTPGVKGAGTTQIDQNVAGEEEVLLASTSFAVLQAGDPKILESIQRSSIGYPQWLLWLAVALGILFLIMLIINIFLCSAMSCSCARTEIIEKEPSIIEDYDPYRSWPGSQYGSRYSLNGKPGYPSGGSTMNSTRSISTNSDHYAIVHSRPGSRYSGPGHKHHHHHRGPPSNIGSHYSGK